MTDTQYLIVARGFSDYIRFIRRNRLNPVCCTQLPTTDAAFTERWERMAQGIESQVCWTDEFLEQSPIGRRTS